MKPRHDEVWCIQASGKELQRCDQQDAAERDVVGPEYGNIKRLICVSLPRELGDDIFLQDSGNRHPGAGHQRDKDEFDHPIAGIVPAFEFAPSESKQ